jgi:hypothetical protein
MPESDARISPTAHYTSYVWFANGMSHPALTSRLGHVLYRALQPLNGAHDLLTRAGNLESMLLARHRLIDRLLTEAIESERIGQVVEIAAGMSPRGFRFAQRYPGLRYIEADLPVMAGTSGRRWPAPDCSARTTTWCTSMRWSRTGRPASRRWLARASISSTGRRSSPRG